MWWIAAAAAGSTYTFPDEQVEGELVRPQGSWIPARGRLGPARALRLEELASDAERDAYAGLERGEDPDAGLLKRAEVLREQALEVRRRLLEPGDDEALGGLAFALEWAHHPEEAAAAWSALLARAPASQHAPSAHLYLAERAFEAGDVATAAEGYAAVPAGHALGDYAAYKLAWCDYNLARFPEAAARLAALGARAEGLLRQEARRDLALVSASLPDGDVVRLVTGACGAEEGCVEALLGRVDRTRADQGLPALAR
jgi:hypothetical protein